MTTGCIQCVVVSSRANWVAGNSLNQGPALRAQTPKPLQPLLLRLLQAARPRPQGRHVCLRPAAILPEMEAQNLQQCQHLC